jgi:hypothetical protein
VLDAPAGPHFLSARSTAIAGWWEPLVQCLLVDRHHLALIYRAGKGLYSADRTPNRYVGIVPQVLSTGYVSRYNLRNRGPGIQPGERRPDLHFETGRVQEPSMEFLTRTTDGADDWKYLVSGARLEWCLIFDRWRPYRLH